jgi:hypothetical protein
MQLVSGPSAGGPSIGLGGEGGIDHGEYGKLWTTTGNTTPPAVMVATRAASESCCREYQRPCVLKSSSKSKSKSSAMASNVIRKRSTHHGEAGLK